MVVTLLMLGVWQWQRGVEKNARLAQIAQRQASAPLTLSAVLQDKGDIRDLPFTVTGTLLNNRVFLLDNRLVDGQVGYEVIVPSQTNAGILMVNLGWVAAPPLRSELPMVSVPADMMTFTGTVYIPEHNPWVTETARVDGQWPKVVQAADFEVFTAHLNTPILPLIMLLDPTLPTGFHRNWQPVVMPPEKHFGYAIQWVALAIAAAVIAFISLRRKAS